MSAFCRVPQSMAHDPYSTEFCSIDCELFYTNL